MRSFRLGLLESLGTPVGPILMHINAPLGPFLLIMQPVGREPFAVLKGCARCTTINQLHAVLQSFSDGISL